MRRKWICAAASLALSQAAFGAAQAQELRIGVLLTLSGGLAPIGADMRDGFNLGLAMNGWTKNGDKLAGATTRVVFEDDQGKTDVGVRAVEKMIKSDRVQIVTGIMLSNVAMAIQPALARSQRILMSANATPAPLAGPNCSPYFLSVAFQNDTFSEAMGALLTKEGVKKVFLIAPNYQAGKDNLAGFERHYRGGQIVDRSLFKLGEADFQADISKIRASGAEAVFGFLPAGMGIAFVKQWQAAGMNTKMKLYSVYTVDALSLPALGKGAVGTFHTNFWSPDSEVAESRAFVRAFRAKFSRRPSHYAAQAYDAARLIAAAVKSLKGKITDGDQLPLARALRTARFDSVRGDFAFNVNGLPIQDIIKREVVLGKDGAPQIVGRGVVFKAHKDSYWQSCPPSGRLP